MSGKPQRKIRRIIFQAAGLLAIAALCGLTSTQAASPVSNVLSRPDLSLARRQELAAKLSSITGSQLNFDEAGALRASGETFSGGSETARELLAAALSGNKLIVLEDASNRADVVFCRVVEGRWRTEAASKLPVFVVLIDFADFSQVSGDRAALAAFHVGWGVLHELDHVVNDSFDADSLGSAGDCEETINRMRRECGLAERAEYFFTLLPGMERSTFATKLVRLAFDQPLPATNKKKRYWLVWDARTVGGWPEQRQLAVK